MAKCGRCNRELKDKHSIQRGYGRICYKKQMQEEEKKPIPGQIEIDDCKAGEVMNSDGKRI